MLAQFEPPTDPQHLANTRTIVHELTFLPGTTPDRFAAVAVPTLLVASDHTAERILEWAHDLADAIPDCRLDVLPGEWHGVDDESLTAAIVDHLN